MGGCVFYIWWNVVFGGVVFGVIVPVWKCKPERRCACDENETIRLVLLMFEL